MILLSSAKIVIFSETTNCYYKKTQKPVKISPKAKG